MDRGRTLAHDMPAASVPDRGDEPFRTVAEGDADPAQPRSVWATPGPTHRVVRRERLHQRLDAIFSARAGQVIGPSGSGKTTLLRSWSVGTNSGEVVWMTAERAHRDKTVLTRDLVEAVRLVVGCDVEARSKPTEETVDLLADAIDRSGRRVIVVIDDVQELAGAESVEVIRTLLSLERESLRVVIAGRGMPDLGLAEIRRRGELLTVAASDLRLDVHETAAVVNSVSGLFVGDASLASIHDQVDGWMAGAVLAGLVVRTSGDSPRVSAAGIDRHRYFDEFFATEVFDSLPTEVQEFLLDTCVLDLLKPGVCTELSQRGDAEEVLWELERGNTFTTWIGGDPPQFRYHRLLRSWLRRRLAQLDPARVLELERCAAAWYSAQGQAAEAIDHRLAADDVDAAAQLIVEYGPEALGEGRYEAIRDWIDSLPDRLVKTNASLLVLLAEAEHRLGHHESTTAVRAILRGLLERCSDDSMPDHLALTVVVQRGTELVVRGKLEAAAAQARQALSMLDLSSWSVVGKTLRFEELLVAMDMASVGDKLMYAGDVAESRLVSRKIVDKLPPDDPCAGAVRARCLGQLAVCEVIDGSRFAAEELALEAIALCGFHRHDPLELGYAQLALLVAGRRVDRASLHADLERRASQIDVPAITCLVGIMRSWAYVHSGDLVSARQQLDSGERALAALDEPGMLHSLARRVAAMVDAGSDEVLLGQRQLAVLAVLATGCSRRSAADQLHLSLNTVKTHARLAYRTLGVTTLEEAIERCGALGITLVAPPGGVR